jgi:hypothetical protein
MLFPIMVKSAVYGLIALAKLQEWRSFRALLKGEQFEKEAEDLQTQLDEAEGLPRKKRNVVEAQANKLALQSLSFETKGNSLDNCAVWLASLADKLNNCKNRFLFGLVGTLGGIVTSVVAVYWLAKNDPSKLFEAFQKIDAIVASLN